MNSINEKITTRRSVYPKSFIDKPIEHEVLEELLKVACSAPSHRSTFPWRFKVFTGESRKDLASYLGEDYKSQNTGSAFSDFKYQKILKKPIQSGAVIAICMQRDAEERIPEWEEIAAVSMAVQNMWIACCELGIGAYWSSPSSMTKRANSFLNLDHSERCLGLFYMGYTDQPFTKDEGRAWKDKVVWM